MTVAIATAEASACPEVKASTLALLFGVERFEMVELA